MRRLAIFSLALLTGCMTAIKHGDIVELDQTVFGFNVAASTGTTQMPAVQLGLIRSKILFVPTSTNKVYAPQFSTFGELNNNGRALLFGGQESSASGGAVLVTNGPSTNDAVRLMLTNALPIHAGALMQINPAVSNQFIQIK